MKQEHKNIGKVANWTYLPDCLDGLALFVFSWIIFANLERKWRKNVEWLEVNHLGGLGKPLWMEEIIQAIKV